MAPTARGPVRPTKFGCGYALVVLVGSMVVLANAGLGLELGIFQTWWGGDLRTFLIAAGVGMAITIVGNLIGRRSWGLVGAIYFAVLGSLVPNIVLQLLVTSRLSGWILGGQRTWLEVLWLALALLTIANLAGASIRPTWRTFYRSRIEDQYTAFDSGRSVRGAVSLNYGNDLCAAVMSFAYVNCLLVSYGIAEVEGGTNAQGYDLYVAAVKTQGLELLAAVPLLDIPNSLRLEAPLVYLDRWTGLTDILFTLTVIAALVPMLKYLLRSDLSVATTVARGESLLRAGDLVAAEQAFRRADDGGDGRAAYVVGEFCEERGDLHEAEDAYARGRDRGHGPAVVKLVAILRRRGDEAGAAAVLTRAREEDPFFELPPDEQEQPVVAPDPTPGRPRHLRQRPDTDRRTGG